MTTAPAESASPAEVVEEDWRARLARRNRLLSRLIYIFARLIYATIRVHCENFEGLIPEEGGAILVTWHGRTFIPANLLRNRGYWALISLSRDGELQDHIFRRFGFQTVRGSTGRGGIKGALQMARKVKEGGILAFTPDGPRGPTHKVQLGVILMAEKSGAPIIPVGISAGPRWAAGSWDAYMIPRPFAHAYFLVGQPIRVPPNLDEAQRQVYADQVEIAINRLEREAERRAGFPDYPPEWRTEA
ncbi:MAG TPA: lysophospholipid acyltransferase family protein [Chthonomonadaceae bacterium]|nr:lysophospholipid acyltransferase family protein [Chthonomonadaceae bacterium]